MVPTHVDAHAGTRQAQRAPPARRAARRVAGRHRLARCGGSLPAPRRAALVRAAGGARHKISVWEMHTRDCPTCRRAHDDAEATAKVLLVAAAAAAASGELAAAVTLLMTSELSRRTALWFETEDVKFDR